MNKRISNSVSTGLNFIFSQVIATGLLFCYQYYLAYLTDEIIVSYYVILHTTANGFFNLFSLGFNQASIYYKSKSNITDLYTDWLSRLQVILLLISVFIGIVIPESRIFLISLLFVVFNLSNLSLLSQNKYNEFNIRKILSVLLLFISTYTLHYLNTGITKSLIEIAYLIAFLPLLQVRFVKTSYRINRILLLFKCFWIYSKDAYLSNLVSFISYRGPIYSSLFYLGYKSQAHFSLALTASEVIFILVNFSNTYIFSHFASLTNEDDYSKNIKKLSKYFLIFSILLSIMTGILLKFLIPENFDNILIIKLFMLQSISNLLLIPVKFNTTIFLLKDNTKDILRISIIHMIILNVFFTIGCFLFDITVATLLSIIAYLFTLFYSNNLIRKNEYLLH